VRPWKRAYQEILRQSCHWSLSELQDRAAIPNLFEYFPNFRIWYSSDDHSHSKDDFNSWVRGYILQFGIGQGLIVAVLSLLLFAPRRGQAPEASTSGLVR
jgi:hypothetical protein